MQSNNGHEGCAAPQVAGANPSADACEKETHGEQSPSAEQIQEWARRREIHDAACREHGRICNINAHGTELLDALVLVLPLAERYLTLCAAKSHHDQGAVEIARAAIAKAVKG